MKLPYRFIALLVVALWVANCTRTIKPTTGDVPATTLPSSTQVSDNQVLGHWELVSIQQEKLTVRPGTFIKIMATDYHLYAGCNNINGAINASKNQLKLFEGSSTMMACDGMQYEQQLSALLLRVSGYKIKGDEMLMNTTDGASLTWKKATTNTKLVGKKLKVIGLTDNGKVLSSSNPPRQFLTFQEGYNMTGSAGCNYVNGTYEIIGNQLHLRGLMSSKMGCGEEEKRIYEGALITHLNNTPLTIEVSGDMIILRDKQGAVAVQLVPE